jgi:ribosomal protein S18 acetylase RimI-like enzyme
MQVTIRRAEARDVPQMLALVRELAVFERAPNEVTVSEQPMLDAGFGPDPVWVGWVAQLQLAVGAMEELADEKMSQLADGDLVGMAVCYERYSTWKGRRLYLEDIIVTEAARGHRIGDKLFRHCAAYAVEMNYSGMLWQVLDWNVDAVRFYDRFGAKYSKDWLNGSLELEQLKNLAAR